MVLDLEHVRHLVLPATAIAVIPAGVMARTTRAAVLETLGQEYVEALQVKSPTGYPIQSPYVAITNRQAEIMMRIASEFGFTPASRGRISTRYSEERSLFDLIEETEESNDEESRIEN